MAKITSQFTQKFKFPTSTLEMLLPRLLDILETVEVDEDQGLVYPGLTEETAYQNLSKESFWDHPLTIKVIKFRLRLYKTDYGRLAVRLLNEVPADRKIYKAGVLTWSGPASTYNFEQFKALYAILSQIHSEVSK